MGASRRSSAHRPRSEISAGTVRITADSAIRIVTAAAGLHPERISPSANVPDVPNVAADSTASPSPAPANPDPRRSRATATVSSNLA